WVTGQRSCLVDGPDWCQVIHELRAYTKSGCGQPAGENLAEGDQITGDIVDAEPALVRGAEPSHHLIQNQQRAISMRDVFERLVETFLRCHGAHIAGCGFGDNAGNLSWIIGKSLLDG